MLLPSFSLSTVTTTATFSLLFSLRRINHRNFNFSAMSSSAINFQPHAFAGNPIKPKTPKSISPNSAFESLKTHLLSPNNDLISPNFKLLPFRKGRPLAGSEPDPLKLGPKWHLGWIDLSDWRSLLGDSPNSRVDKLVYLGAKSEFGENDGGGEKEEIYWAIDVGEDEKLVVEFGNKCLSFVELRTLMVATDWSDSNSMSDLAVAGHVCYDFRPGYLFTYFTCAELFQLFVYVLYLRCFS